MVQSCPQAMKSTVPVSPVQSHDVKPQAPRKKGIACPVNRNRVTKQQGPTTLPKRTRPPVIERLAPLLDPAGRSNLLADFTYPADAAIEVERAMGSVSLALYMESSWYYIEKLPNWRQPQTYSKLEFRFKLHLLKGLGDYKIYSMNTVKVYLSTATPDDEPRIGKLFRWRF